MNAREMGKRIIEDVEIALLFGVLAAVWAVSTYYAVFICTLF